MARPAQAYRNLSCRQTGSWAKLHDVKDQLIPELQIIQKYHKIMKLDTAWLGVTACHATTQQAAAESFSQTVAAGITLR
jgi:hypothetical protein